MNISFRFVVVVAVCLLVACSEMPNLKTDPVNVKVKIHDPAFAYFDFIKQGAFVANFNFDMLEFEDGNGMGLSFAKDMMKKIKKFNHQIALFGPELFKQQLGDKMAKSILLAYHQDDKLPVIDKKQMLEKKLPARFMLFSKLKKDVISKRIARKRKPDGSLSEAKKDQFLVTQRHILIEVDIFDAIRGQWVWAAEFELIKKAKKKSHVTQQSKDNFINVIVNLLFGQDKTIDEYPEPEDLFSMISMVQESFSRRLSLTK